MEKHPYRGKEGKCIHCGQWEYDYEAHYDIKKDNHTQVAPVEAKVMRKTKFEKLAELNAEIYVKGGKDVISQLCAVISTLTKGTKYKTIGKEIIESAYSEFYT